MNCRLLLLAGAALLAAAAARADLYASFDFDTIAAHSDVNQLRTPQLSFHSAVFRPLLDAEGLEIAGSDRWTFTDEYGPIFAETPALFGWGDAPSGLNALSALDGPVYLKFDQAYNLGRFSAQLDNSTWGDLFGTQILFLSGDTIVDTIDFDATQPGLALHKGGVAGVTGIVLGGGAFYDNLVVAGAAIPEPSTYGLIAGGATLAFVLWRRRRR